MNGRRRGVKTGLDMVVVIEVVRDDAGANARQFGAVRGAGWRDAQNGSPMFCKIDVKIHRTIENDGQM